MTMHSSDEELKKCDLDDCGGALVKLLTRPSYGKKKAKGRKMGDLTEEFIKDSREELKKQRDELEQNR